MKNRVSKLSSTIIVFTAVTALGGVSIANAEGCQGTGSHQMHKGSSGTMTHQGKGMKSGGKQKMSRQMMQQGKGMKGGRRGDMLGNERGIKRMMETLDVTDTQRDSIWKIIDDRRSAQRKLASDIQSQRKALRELNTSSNSDLGKVKEIASTLSSLIEEQIVESANIMILIHNVLTDEQKKKMKEQKQTRGKQYQSCSK